MAMNNPNDANEGNPEKGTRSTGNTSHRGFASMDPAQQRAIARQGGRAAHASGNAHQFTSEEARAAGKKSHSGRARAGNLPGDGSSTPVRADEVPARDEEGRGERVNTDIERPRENNGR